MVHKSDKFTDFKRSFENCQCIFANRSMGKVEGENASQAGLLLSIGSF